MIASALTLAQIVPDAMVVPILVGALLLGALSAALLIYGFVPDEVDEEDLYGYRETKRARLLAQNDLYRIALPGVKMFAHHVARVPDSLFGGWVGERRVSLRKMLVRSGYLGAYTPNEFVGLMGVSTCAFFVFAASMSFAIQGRLELSIVLASALVLGPALPLISLSDAIQKRLVEIERQLPYAVDTLILSMRAGLDFISALDRVVNLGLEQDPDDAMIQELGVVLQEIRVGTTRADALINLVERVQSDYLRGMVGAIVQAERRGTPLADVLEIQVKTLRNKRSQRIEKAASEAAVKVLLPLLLIFSSVLVLIFGAMFIKIQATGF